MTQHPFHLAAREPFRFVDYEGLVMPTGRRAATLRELAEAVREVRPEVIHHHFYRTPLWHRFGSWDYPNDFAQWSAHALRDLLLAEKLASIDPYLHRDIENLREELLNLLEDHLDELPAAAGVPLGREFHFTLGRFIALPSERTAATLAEMRDGLALIPLSSLFYHFGESRLSRPGSGADDISHWIEAQFGSHPLAAKLRAIDFHFYSLSELRTGIVAAFDEHRGEATP